MQKFVRRGGVHLLHHRHQDAPGGFGISLGVVMIKGVTDVRGQRFKTVTRQFRPDAPSYFTGAGIIKYGSGQIKMLQYRAQMFDVEGGVMSNHDVRAGQPFQKFRRNGGKFALSVAIPAGTTATVFVPARSAEAVTEGGRPAGQSKGVKFLRQKNGRAVFAVESGNYEFKSVLPNS